MNIKETSIEKIIRKNTPEFVIGTSYFVEKYHSSKLQCIVHFCSGVYVEKGIDDINNTLKKYSMAYPDFVLLNNKQKELFNKAIYNADNGLYYDNPLVYKNGWYIEAFGDYWHSKQITCIDEKLHEKQVKEAYEKSGNHVLILWQHDILYHWNEYCLPKINEYINEFKKYNECDDIDLISDNKILSDNAISCINDNEYYQTIDNKLQIINELTDFYHNNIKLLYNGSVPHIA